MREQLEGKVHGVHCISAVARIGLDSLLDDVTKTLMQTHMPQSEPVITERSAEKVPMLRPSSVDRTRVVVTRKRGKYVVTARKAERVAGMVKKSDRNALLQFHEYIRRLGVVAALEEARIKHGDVVVIGRLELEWE